MIFFRLKAEDAAQRAQKRATGGGPLPSPQQLPLHMEMARSMMTKDLAMADNVQEFGVITDDESITVEYTGERSFSQFSFLI